MKKTMIALVALMLFAVGAQAQMPSSPVSFYVGGALSLPSAPDTFKDSYKNGFHGFAGIGLNAMPMLQFVGKAEFNSFGFNFDSYGSPGLDEGGKQQIWMFGGDARLAPGVPASPFKPFALAGIGMASVKTSDFSGSDLTLATSVNSQLESVTKMYWNIGLGMEFKSGPAMSFFVQGRYVNITTEGDPIKFIPISLGLKFF
jgi:opacity protein-like surface antigen